jgi:endonuclease/exonuclease/phosphatase family metal-dependent hydrolase
LFASFACLTLLGCSDDPDVVTEPPPSIAAVTYNGGLALGFVSAALERRPLVADAVAGLDADVVCLQEIWLADDVSAVTNAAAATLPNTIFPAPVGSGMTGTAACTQTELDPLVTCGTMAGCDTVCGDELVTCIVTNCGPEFTALNTNAPGCSQCLQANIGAPINDILDTCTMESAEYTYGGSFGIGLLTSHAILAQEEKVLDSTTTRRAVIYAQLDTDIGPVHTFCTHLTAVFDETEIPYPKPTGSWQEEQTAQITELLAWVEEKSGGAPVMVMGDMNTGPAGDGYAAEVGANYTMFTDAGLAAPYVDAGGPCTFCGENPLTGIDHAESVLIDHVLIKGFTAPQTSGSRVLDQEITVPICTVDSPARLSDHYGIHVNVTTTP